MRIHPARLRTSLIISLQNVISLNNGFKLRTSVLEALCQDRVIPYFKKTDDCINSDEKIPFSRWMLAVFT